MAIVFNVRKFSKIGLFHLKVQPCENLWKLLSRFLYVLKLYLNFSLYNGVVCQLFNCSISLINEKDNRKCYKKATF